MLVFIEWTVWGVGSGKQSLSIQYISWLGEELDRMQMLNFPFQRMLSDCDLLLLYKVRKRVIFVSDEPICSFGEVDHASPKTRASEQQARACCVCLARCRYLFKLHCDTYITPRPLSTPAESPASIPLPAR